MLLKGESQSCEHAAEPTQSQSQSQSQNQNQNQQVLSSSMLNVMESQLMQKEEREEREQEHREHEEEKWHTASAINNLRIELSTL